MLDFESNIGDLLFQVKQRPRIGCAIANANDPQSQFYVKVNLENLNNILLNSFKIHTKMYKIYT